MTVSAIASLTVGSTRHKAFPVSAPEHGPARVTEYDRTALRPHRYASNGRPTEPPERRLIDIPRITRNRLLEEPVGYRQIVIDAQTRERQRIHGDEARGVVVSDLRDLAGPKAELAHHSAHGCNLRFIVRRKLAPRSPSEHRGV